MNQNRVHPRRTWFAIAAGLGLASGISKSGISNSGMSNQSAWGDDTPLANLYVPDDTDRSVNGGIDHLMAAQRDDGSIRDKDHKIAMTSLAIMAMASIGITPSDHDQRSQAMDRALAFVLNENHQDAHGYYGDRDGSRMYGHGIITLMLTEMLGMGSSPEQNRLIHEALTNALELILAAQAVSKPEKLRGGWRYAPSSHDSDLSVSVWQLMAMRSAKNDGLNVPGEAIDLAISYLKHSYAAPREHGGKFRDKVSGFSYTPGSHHPTFTMTAAGLLAMQVCGQYESPMVTGAADWLLEHPPKVKERFFFYGIYYYAQAMHQVGGKYAKRADGLVPELLIPAQRDDGSWLAPGGEERNVGRVYATSLAILSLSVRYHYLPIYQK